MITLSIFYYLYLLVVLFVVIYSLFNIYHLLRFGFLSWLNIVVILFYILVLCLFLLASFNILLSIDWTQPLIDFSFPSTI